eukprot:2336837-Pleurochrysis_carterae.AAC.1
MTVQEVVISATSPSALLGDGLPFGMPVAAAGLETRSGDYSGFETVQGARQTAGDSARREQVKGDSARRQAVGDSARPKASGEEGQRKSPGGGDRARRLAAKSGARRRVVRGEGWRTAPDGESMVKGSARRRAVRDGARHSVARELTAQGAGLRAAGLRKASGCARGTAQGAGR